VTDLYRLRMILHVFSGGEADFDCRKGLDRLRRWRVLGNSVRSDPCYWLSRRRHNNERDRDHIGVA
jgi:hypothetical protein